MEKKLQNQVVKYLKENNIFYEVRSPHGFSYKKGIPDLFIVINGLHIELELKDKAGKLSNMQLKYKEIFNNHKIPHFTINSLDNLKTIINKYR